KQKRLLAETERFIGTNAAQFGMQLVLQLRFGLIRHHHIGATGDQRVKDRFIVIRNDDCCPMKMLTVKGLVRTATWRDHANARLVNGVQGRKSLDILATCQWSLVVFDNRRREVCRLQASKGNGDAAGGNVKLPVEQVVGELGPTRFDDLQANT